MIKLIALVLALTFVLSLAGCNEQQPNGRDTQPNPTETNQTTDIPNEDDGDSDSNTKNLLKLQYREVLGVELETEGPKANNIHLEYSDVPELQNQRFENNEAMKVFSNYINEAFSVELDSNWNVFVHYYDEDKTVGMAEFVYMIGEINTDKSIAFNLNNGIADTVYYKNLDCEVNEEALLNRVRKFNNKYEQERKVLEKDEKLVKETTSYTYYYTVNKLIYAYTVFYAYGEHQLVNNDYGTVCMIDEDGNAVK